jgi:hypothetical protein
MHYIAPFLAACVTGVSVVGAVPLIAVKLLLGLQAGFPNILNTPPVALVATLVAYFVLVLIPQAVTCAQQRFCNGYKVVPVPIWITTGAEIVVVSGMLCATTIQYFSPLL